MSSAVVTGIFKLQLLYIPTLNKIFCVYSLEVPQWGTSNEYTHVFMKK